MDTIINLERMFQLILNRDPRDLNENKTTESWRLKQVNIWESISAGEYEREHLEKVLTSTELMLKLFLNNYQTSFNPFIEYIFHQMQNIFHSLIVRKAVSNFAFDNLLNVFNLIAKIIMKHPCDLGIRSLANFYKSSVDEIKLKQGAECDTTSLVVEELSMHLRIISIVYEGICNTQKCKMQNESGATEELMKCTITTNQECELFVKLVFENCEVLMIQTLIDVIPKFIECTRCYTLYWLIWEEVCNVYRMSSDAETSKIFIILCYLSDLYFVVDNKEVMTNIFADNIYWILIQNGLINSNPAVRKQALFLAKTSLNYISENEINFYCYKKEIEAFEEEEEERLTGKLPLIYWENGMKYDELKELCIIVEYLEEKQVHILKPIFGMIENFLKNIKEQKVDILWILIVIERMLSHDNMKIVREGIANLMKISVNNYNEKHGMTKAIKMLLTSLNCTQVYMSDLPVLMEELNLYFKNCTKHENGKYFFRILLEEMCDIQWSSEALCAITYCLHSIKSNKYWYVKEMNLIKKLLLNRTANHYTYIKSGIQCQLLLTAIHLIDGNSVSLEDVDTFLNCFHRKILQRKTVMWESTVKWIRNCFSVEDAHNFVRSTLGKRNIGRMIVFLCDSYPDNETFLNDMKYLLKNISTLFIDINARPYCDKQIVDLYLSIICDVMRESCGDSKFCNIFSQFVPNIVLYIKLKLESVKHIRDFETCKILMNNLRTILSNNRDHLMLSDVMREWFEEIVKNLVNKSELNREFPVEKYVQITLASTIMDYIECETDGIESYVRGEMNSSLVKTSEDLLVMKDLHTLWGRMNSEFSRGKWEILSKSLKSPTNLLNFRKGEFVSSCFEALDLSGHTVLFPLISVLGKALPSLLHESRVEELIHLIWRLVMERKKNEEYQRLLKQYTEAIFQLEVILNGNSDIREMLVNSTQVKNNLIVDSEVLRLHFTEQVYCQWMLSENATTNTANLLVKHMLKIGFHQGGIYLLKEVLPLSLVFGQIPGKDERLIRELCSLVELSRLSPLTNDFRSSSEVRASSIQIILTLNPSNEIHSLFCESLFESLKILDENNSRKQTRYFSGSNVHRVKQRLFQALLVLEPFMRKGGSEKLWNWLSKKISLENNQPSVRYLQEWLLLRIINGNPRFRDSLWMYFDEALEKRPRSICSFISIIYHSVKCSGDNEMADLMERAVKTFLPYCMAQHFTVRLYAQVTLEKLLETAGNRRLKTITEEYGTIKKSLNESIKRGNAEKNSTKIREDFYFTAFHPVEHYSLRTIFFDLPRLANVNSEELIPEHVFTKIGVDDKKSFIPLRNENDALVKFSCGKWILEGSKENNFTEDSDEKEESEMLNFQKKIIPVKYLTPNREELLESASFSSKKVVKDGLVVVASLIDRMPNLGGLSRTCEVFGACELVIGSLNYAQDKQFQSVSVTAEKWITVSEVKSFYLADYLMKMKRNGYTVLAAEQTVNSQPLQSVKFPKKSLLLLGNEKEGIPPTLLPLMDICIEIPQIGVIRSLNVHVSGALFVWEYAKQHHFTS